MTQISDNFVDRYNRTISPLSENFNYKAIDKRSLADEALQEQIRRTGNIYIVDQPVQVNSSTLFSSREINDNRSSTLNSTTISKVEIFTAIESDSELINQVMNNNILSAVEQTFSEFGLQSKNGGKLQLYQQDDPLSQLNSLVQLGIQEIQNKGVNVKTLDKFLYQLSINIDDAVKQSEEDLQVLVPSLNNKKISNYSYGDAFSGLSIWQSEDIERNVIRQQFEIINTDGDKVKIEAKYFNEGSISTDEYRKELKSLNVTITEGSLSVKEQQQFNLFLDDFAKVTNEILAGDVDEANKAFDLLNATDYGFKSINKTEFYEKQNKIEDIVHSFSLNNGKVNTGYGAVTGSPTSVVNQSYVKGGEYNGIRRNTNANLADFDIKFANSYQQPSSGISAPRAYDNKQDYFSSFLYQQGKDKDGLVMEDKQGQLYRYEYNERNRDASGWVAVGKQEVDYERLKTNQQFNEFKLNIYDSGQVTMTYLANNREKDYGISLAKTTTNKTYGNEFDQQVFEDKSGNLYQYQFNDNYGDSGWRQIENTKENQQLLLSRQAQEGYVHNYLVIDESSNKAQLTQMFNYRDAISPVDVSTNMQILN